MGSQASTWEWDENIKQEPCDSCLMPHASFLRKEVIQPHLPIRLPCYDFVPLAPHTFDGSFSYELGHRLRVQTTQVT
jgi:hypothetical protein